MCSCHGVPIYFLFSHHMFKYTEYNCNQFDSHLWLQIERSNSVKLKYQANFSYTCIGFTPSLRLLEALKFIRFFVMPSHYHTHTRAHAFTKKIQINTIAPNYLLITVSIRLSFVYLQQSSSCFLLFLWLFALPFDLAPNFGVIHSIFNIAILICSKFR